MKRIIIVLLLLSIYLEASSQTTFSILHGLQNDLERFVDIDNVEDTLILVFDDNNIDYDDDEYSIRRVTLLKMDYLGQILLQEIDYMYDSLFAMLTGFDFMRKSMDGGFIRGGLIRKRDTTLTTNYYSLNSKATITKYNQNLEKEWMTIIGESWDANNTQYLGGDVWEMSNGDIYMVGGRLKNSILLIMLTKVDSFGNIIWTNFIDTIGNKALGQEIVIKDNEILITGKEYLENIGYAPVDRFFMKLTLDGEVISYQYTNEPGSPHTDKNIVLLDDGTISSVSIVSNFHFRVDQYNFDFDTLWTDVFTLDTIVSNTDWFTGIEQDDNGNIITVGTSFNTEIGQFGFLRKYNNEGEALWTRNYRHIDELYAIQELNDVIPTSDGGYAACGIVSHGPSGIYSDGWVIKVDNMGCLVPGCDSLDVSINENESNFENTTWFKVGPNPVSKNGVLNIYFQGSNSNATENMKNASFVLHDILGNEIRRFDVEEIAMTYIMNFQEIKSGNYVLSLIANNQVVQSEKIVVLK